MMGSKEITQKYYFLFDTNVFNKLCRYSSFHSTFIFSLKENDLNPKEIQEGFYITPFSVLEAIGVKPEYKKIEYNFNDGFIINFLSQEIRNYFENLEELKIENLKIKAIKNRPMDCSDAQKKLYELCVERCVNESDFYQTVILYLVCDYLYKYPYKNDIFKSVFDIFKIHLFFRELYEVSKFRLISNKFDKESNRIKKEIIGTEKAILNTFNGLKPQIAKDYLDTDLVHTVCMGHLVKDGLYPVVGFTFDSYNEILPRISAYKGFIYNVKKSFNISDMKTEDYLFNNRSGVICFLDKNGNVVKKENVIDIPISGYGTDDVFITNEYKKNELNEIAYQLYKVTPEEIKIVEGESK